MYTTVITTYSVLETTAVRQQGIRNIEMFVIRKIIYNTTSDACLDNFMESLILCADESLSMDIFTMMVKGVKIGM